MSIDIVAFFLSFDVCIVLNCLFPLQDAVFDTLTLALFAPLLSPPLALADPFLELRERRSLPERVVPRNRRR